MKLQKMKFIKEATRILLLAFGAALIMQAGKTDDFLVFCVIALFGYLLIDFSYYIKYRVTIEKIK